MAPGSVLSAGNYLANTIIDRCRTFLMSFGIECHPAKISDYNELVADAFKLSSAPENCLSILCISTPSMFELCFKPWHIEHRNNLTTRDPLDQCLKDLFDKLLKELQITDAQIIQDYELTPTRRPKILMQTVGHCCGATHYYQRTDLTNDPWPTDKCVYGVSVHPKYGGWFAYRCVIIFPSVEYPVESVPHNSVKFLTTDEQIIELLREFNENWTANKYRDLGTELGQPTDRYSEIQQSYFNAKPIDRFNLIKHWWENENTDGK